MTVGNLMSHSDSAHPRPVRRNFPNHYLGLQENMAHVDSRHDIWPIFKIALPVRLFLM